MSATVGGTPHTTYKFHVDQALYLTSSHALNIPGGAYIVTKKCQSVTASLSIMLKASTSHTSASCAKVN
jgi:hypothetical protein